MQLLASIQPSYLPWRGYFHIIQRSDIFIFADNLQYNKQNWRNRNRIKTEDGPGWLTVPIQKESIRHRANIDKVLIDNNSRWGLKHWDKIYQAYHRAPFFKKYSSFFEDMYSQNWGKLSDLDIYSIKHICGFLNINTKMMRASELNIQGKRMDYIMDACKKLGATHYLSGPTAKAYIEEKKFTDAGVLLEYQNYDYPEYPQSYGKFIDYMSIVDLLFNCGEDSRKYIWPKR